jgi:hypothetical protein
VTLKATRQTAPRSRKTRPKLFPLMTANSPGGPDFPAFFVSLCGLGHRPENGPGLLARDACKFLGLSDSANSWALLADTRTNWEFFHIVGGNRG